ncbi:hypothetical protein GEMRC1_005429 [Eukaryota sp. GEM-RC1]
MLDNMESCSTALAEHNLFEPNVKRSRSSLSAAEELGYTVLSLHWLKTPKLLSGGNMKDVTVTINWLRLLEITLHFKQHLFHLNKCFLLQAGQPLNFMLLCLIKVLLHWLV